MDGSATLEDRDAILASMAAAVREVTARLEAVCEEIKRLEQESEAA
jgi:hypothetical protein